MPSVRAPFSLLTLAATLAALTATTPALAEGADAVPAAAAEAVAPAAAPATDVAPDTPELAGARVVADREGAVARSATGLALTAKDTPQAVQTLDAATIEAWGVDDVNAVLDLAIGVNVERVETDRTYYNARGFDIKNFLVDGTGVPLHWSNIVGGLDSALYEKVEIVRGAAGLLAGTGNPSAAINFIRKRPGDKTEGSVKTTIGAWDKRRVEADTTVLLGERWKTRAIAVMQDAGSYLDNYENERSALGAIVEGQLTDTLLLTIGYTDQRSKGTGALWGALPLLDSNGDMTDYDVSASTTMDWTFYQTESRTAFVELVQELSSGWEWKTTLTQNRYEEPSELFYVYGTPDATTGLGLMGWPGSYFAHADRKLLDSSLAGDYEFGGRRHEFTVGLSIADVESGYLTYDADPLDPAWGPLPAFPGWDGTEIGRPDFGAGYVSADMQNDFRRIYAATRYNLNDEVKVVAGINAVSVEGEGVSFGAPQDRDERELSPYLGVVWSLDAQTNLYASYSDIFDPQVETDIHHDPLGSAQGTNLEVGAKYLSDDQRRETSVALFRIDQDNLAEVAGWDPLTSTNYYRGTEVSSQGIELEFTGQLTDAWKLGGGYTWLEIKDADGEDARVFMPRQTLKLMTSFRPQPLPRMEIGGAARWQDDIRVAPGSAIRQDAYAVVSAYVSYDAAENLELSLNVDNAFDEKYLTSLYWDQSLYGEPRAVSASLKFAF